ncbi:MAG: phosphatase PAP2 family protein [Patescibacteria group bacterium]
MSDLSLGIVMVLAIAGLFLYFPTNRIKAPGRWFFQDTWFDKYIPLVPYFIIPYVAYYPYLIATPILMWGTLYAAEFFTCLAIAGWSAAAFWYFFPAGILRKHDIRPDIFSRMIIWLYENDHENNTIPSSHVFHAIICSYFLALAYSSYVLLFATIGFFVAISTVFVKQHHAADILGGMVWALASISIASYIVG